MLAAMPRSPIRRLVLNDVGPFVPRAALVRLAGYVGKDPVFADLAGLEAYLRQVTGVFAARRRRMALTSPSTAIAATPKAG